LVGDAAARPARRFVGVDLAWGERNATGLCALTADGAVLESSRAAGDDEICAWLDPHVGGDVLVGLDAPLIVDNPTGQRRCERELAAVFAGRQAGAHPCNRSMPWFADGGRAHRLARRLRLSLDPHLGTGKPDRTALEVYPHATIVALFGLPRTLKYKAKTRRTLEERRDAFTRLIELLESLQSADPPLDLASSSDWHRLRAEVMAAPGGAALDRAEDEVDAYVCAYTSLYYWRWGTRRCAILGDDREGAVVTPVDDVARRRLAAWRGRAAQVT
jgi:predicted RNase H-like nuclease